MTRSGNSAECTKNEIGTTAPIDTVPVLVFRFEMGKAAIPPGLKPVSKNSKPAPTKKKGKDSDAKKKKPKSDLTWIENTLKMLFVFILFLIGSWIDVIDQKWIALCCFGMLRYISRGWRRNRNKKEGGTPQSKFFEDKEKEKEQSN